MNQQSSQERRERGQLAITLDDAELTGSESVCEFVMPDTEPCGQEKRPVMDGH